jgi:hypothetical protein
MSLTLRNFQNSATQIKFTNNNNNNNNNNNFPNYRERPAREH